MTTPSGFSARTRKWRGGSSGSRFTPTPSVERVEMVQRIDEYLSALRDHIESLTDPDELSAAHEWEEWVSSHRAGVDPFTERVGMPSIPEPKPEDLKPFMRGLSPYGPEARHS
jgi:hypothetical protein